MEHSREPRLSVKVRTNDINLLALIYCRILVILVRVLIVMRSSARADCSTDDIAARIPTLTH